MYHITSSHHVQKNPWNTRSRKLMQDRAVRHASVCYKVSSSITADHRTPSSACARTSRDVRQCVCNKCHKRLATGMRERGRGGGGLVGGLERGCTAGGYTQDVVATYWQGENRENGKPEAGKPENRKTSR